MAVLADGTGLGAAVVGRVVGGRVVDGTGDGTEVGRCVGGRVVDGTGDGAEVGGCVGGRVVDGTGDGAEVVVGEADAVGAGFAPPSSANALAAATVPNTATPVAVTAMSRARFAGLESMQWLQTAIMAPRVGALDRKDAWDPDRLSPTV